MIHKFNRAVLLLATFTASVLTTGCKDDEQTPNNTEGLRNYMVSTHSLFHTYYTPKKANIFAHGKAIWGDWYGNENAAYRETMDRILVDDYEQINAKHYFFLDFEVAQKYIDNQSHNPGQVVADKKEIISPFKEYAEYYADTTHLTEHMIEENDASGFDGCVLPLIAIDVVCNKDFDQDHPAGSKLNDILLYNQRLESYLFLQDKSNNGKPISSIADFKPRKLSELPENPVYLMESNFEIIFDHSPSSPGTYEFTVKFTFGEDPLTGETVDIAPAKVSIDF